MTFSVRRLLSVITLSSCLLGLAAPAGADGGSKLDKVLREARRDGSLHRVIIQAAPGSASALKASLQQQGEVKAEHPGIAGLTVVLRGADLAALEANPAVLAVSIDAEVTAFGTAPAKGSVANAAGQRTPGSARAPKVDGLRDILGLSPSRFTGAGIRVAVVDSGIDPYADVAANVAGFWDFTAGGIRTTPRDEYGHGTHVAGLIASTGRGSDGEFAGVAPASTLYGFKVLDAGGRGYASDVVNALEFIVANKLSQAPGAFKVDIINLSLGHPIYEPASTDPLVRAVENATRAGIVVVTAAGNIGRRSDGLPGYAGVTSPGNAPSAITVGAVDTRSTAGIADDVVALFSSRGPTWFDAYGKPDVVAPGVGLVSNAARGAALFDAYPDLLTKAGSGGGRFAILSGTSMAAAVTTGVASLVLEASRTASTGHPGFTPNALKAVLQYTAVSIADEAGQAYDALTQGTGAVNARGALVLARAIDTSMPEGSHWMRGQPPAQTVIDGSVVPWSQALVWADNIVWGTDALDVNGLQWSTNIVWGTAARHNIVWGTAERQNIVWGTTEWAAGLVWDDRLIGQMIASNIVWGTAQFHDIAWGTLTAENIVWGTYFGANIVWGTRQNIVWGTRQNIVWGTRQNIVWGTFTPEQLQDVAWDTAYGSGY